MSELRIEDIDIGERDRSDLGDIAELAESIAAVGMLHPVVVTAEAELVAGGRRLAAARHLGWAEVPVTIVDFTTVAKALRAEADENTCRKPLTPYEASRARERRAKILAPKAREAQARPGQPRSSNLDERPGPVRKVAATGTGYSGSTLDKVDRIRDVAERGVVRHGQAEMPVPEPVREVALEALEDVKQSGAAVDRSSRRVEAALAGFIEESSDVQRAKFRRRWRGAFSAAMELERFDAERVAEVLEPDEWDEIALAAKGINDWYARLLAARGDRLRVINGGA